nr:reverse transcriptase domain-containing protein [Tanacetum cinerariifolium]
MSPRMTIRSTGRPAAASRGGGTSGRADRGGGRTRGHSGDQGDGRIDGQCRQVGGQGSKPAAASRGGGTSGRADRGGGRTRGRSGDQGDGRIDGQCRQVGGQGSKVNDGVNRVHDLSTIIAKQLQNLLPTIVAQVGNQGRGQGNGRNQNDDAANDNIQGDISRGCTYKDFLACNPKEYDGKGGVIVYTRWIKKMESVQDMSGCRDNQKVKYTASLFIGKALTWWNSQIHTRGQEAIVGMVAATKPKTIQKAVQIAGTLTDEALGNGSIKKNLEKRENRGEPSKDRNEREDNKRIRTGNALSTTTNPVKRKKHRVVPRNVNPINARNPTVRSCYECGSTDHIRNQGNQARGRAFMLGAEEARQDPNIMTGMDWLSEHKAEIICHKKVVRIPILDGKVLRVLGENLEEKVRQLMSAKAKEKNFKRSPQLVSEPVALY